MLRRNRLLLLGVPIGIVLVSALVFYRFGNTSSLLISSLLHRLPDSSHLSRIREDLLGQDGFRKMLIGHEQATMTRLRESGKKSYVTKYIYRTQTSVFDLPTFWDDWETWVRTDIVQGRPLTSFLIRLGIVKDTNAVTFFGSQCESTICRALMRSLIAAGNAMFDWGILKPFRLNITESDETSSVSRTRLRKDAWEAMVWEMHLRGQGITYMDLAGGP